MVARRRCGRYAGESGQRRHGRGCGRARVSQGEVIGRRITARGGPERSGHVAGDPCELRRGGARDGVGNAASPVLGCGKEVDVKVEDIEAELWADWLARDAVERPGELAEARRSSLRRWRSEMERSERVEVASEASTRCVAACGRCWS